MASDLKQENNRSIFLIMAASLGVSAFFQFDLSSLSDVVEVLIAGSGGIVLSAVLVMLANLLPQGIKHKLIFTRIKDELPACRVNQVCKKDSRIEYELVEKRWPQVFAVDIDGSTRNSRWYQQIYKSVKDKQEVLQAHRNFLLYRDAFSGLFLILLITLIWSWFGSSEIIGDIKPMVFWLQGVLTALSLVAARTAGNRFVVNAVAAAE